MSFTRKSKDLKDVPNMTTQVKEDIDLLWDEAKRMGYSSIRDYVKHQYENFGGQIKLEILDEKFENFMMLVQKKEPKLYGKGNWGSASTFRDYLHESVLDIDTRLKQLEYEYKNQVQSFAGLIDVLPHMTKTPVGMGESMSAENYEFYSLIYHKCREFFVELLNNDETYNAYLGQLEEQSKERAKLDIDAVVKKIEGE